MGIIETDSKHQRRLLEAFIVGNDDLDRLEELSSSFNIFNAIGMASQEIRHSRTLSFLLGAQNNHGLGQGFVKRFLKRAAIEAQNSISAVDIDISNFADAETRCEWNSIDILIMCPSAKLVVAIENKILAGEHGDQLARYRRILDAHAEWLSYRKLYCFLTVDGLAPKDADESSYWCALDYRMIYDELGAALRAGSSRADQLVLVSHYLELLRRRVLEDNEVAELARKIYHNHREALDIIFEHRPDVRLEISDYLLGLVRAQPSLREGPSSGKYVRFTPISWKFDTSIHVTTKAFRDHYVAFEFAVNAEAREPVVRLELVLGPVSEPHQSDLFDAITGALNVNLKKTGAYPRVWYYDALPITLTDQQNMDVVYKEIELWWRAFFDEHLPRVEAAVAAVLSA